MSGTCGYVEDLVSFEMNKDYTVIIGEKKADNLTDDFRRRKVSRTVTPLRSDRVLRTPQMELTSNRSEQLSACIGT